MNFLQASDKLYHEYNIKEKSNSMYSGNTLLVRVMYRTPPAAWAEADEGEAGFCPHRDESIVGLTHGG